MEFLRENQISIINFIQGICAIIMLLTLITKNMSRSRKMVIFFLELSALCLLIAVEFSYTYRGTPGHFAYIVVRLSKILDHFFALMTIFVFNIYMKDVFLHEVGLKKSPVLLNIVDFIFLLGISCLVVAEFFGLYYKIDETNNYVRQNGRIVSYIIPFVSLSLQLVCLIYHRKKIPWRNFLPLVLFIVFPMIMSVLQFFANGLALGSLSTVGMVIVLYVFELQNLNLAVERAHRLEVEMLERYKKELEETVRIRTRELRVANEKAENLLLNILPKEVAKELTEHPNRVIAHRIPKATVLFTDIVGFTKMSSGMSADETVAMLNEMFSLFDERAEREGIEKIKTIGDAYMAVVGLSSKSVENGDEARMIRFAHGLLDDVRTFNETFPVKVQIRVGINTGALVAGVIGKTKFIYDIWGDTVNVASRMESTGAPMRIHVSESTYGYVKNDFAWQGPVQVEVKGKGLMNGYFL